MFLTVDGPIDEGYLLMGFQADMKWDKIGTKLTQNRKMRGHYKQDLMLKTGFSEHDPPTIKKSHLIFQ